MLTFHIVSIFPEIVENYTKFSILKRAKEKNLIDFKFYNIRDFTKDKHRRVDDKPYSGGPGMVMNAEPILLCVEKIISEIPHLNLSEKLPRQNSLNFATPSKEEGELSEKKNSKIKVKIKIVNFIPNNKKWTNVKAKNFSKKYTDIILICGRYEGIDYRVQKILKSEKISIGDYVLTGGEIPAMAVIDSIARQVKGVLGDFNSLEEKRKNELGEEINSDEEVYTRPEILEWSDKNGKVKKYKVPKVFLSGNHKLLKEYKEKKQR
jgi:tRNA (guanine37-N1)-methyltransferase